LFLATRTNGMLGPRGREGAVLSDTGKNDAEPMAEKREKKKRHQQGAEFGRSLGFAPFSFC